MNSDKAILGVLITGILVVYTAIVFAFFGSEGDTRVIYLFLIGLPIAISLFAVPKLGLIVLGILVYSLDWISESLVFMPRETTWLIDILLVMFVVRIIVTSPWRKLNMSKIEKWIYVALVFSIISALMNGISQVTYLVGFRVAFKYILLFIAVYHMDVSREWMRGFFKLLVVIALIQPAVIILQWRFTSWVSPDDLAGTFGLGQTGRVAFYLLLIIAFYISQAIERKRFKSSMLIPLCWLLIAPILGEAKFFFMVLPVLLIYLLRADFFKRPAIAIGLSIVGIIIIVSVDYVIKQSGYWLEGRNPITYIAQIGEVYTSELDESSTVTGPRRIHQLASSTRLAAGSPKDFFFGNGPGSITLSFVAARHSKTMEYFSKWRLNSASPTIAWLLIEYGYLGTILMVIPLALIYRRGKYLRRSDDQELRIYGRWLEGLTFLYGLWMVYTSVLQIDASSYLFWVTAAMLVRLSYEEEARFEMKTTMERITEARQPVRTLATESAVTH
ncbi:hypothetical protein KKC97_03650 [bacterium]|nr:hypothetical protein [bacterium]MBU1636738.1 hypothetical protein [bacterium]